MLSLPGLHSAAKKKKNLVEEKHPEDRGCERDDRTREIRDGRKGEESCGWNKEDNRPALHTEQPVAVSFGSTQRTGPHHPK